MNHPPMAYRLDEAGNAIPAPVEVEVECTNEDCEAYEELISLVASTDSIFICGGCSQVITDVRVIPAVTESS